MSIPVLIIPVLNRFDLLEQCIQSIDYPIDNLLIIDNSNSYILPDGLYAGSVQVLKGLDCLMKIIIPHTTKMATTRKE